MDITYIGHACFRIKGKDATIVIDPYNAQETGLKLPNLEADIVTVSHHHTDHNDSGSVEGEPLIIDMPGEYEKSGVRIYGFQTYHDKSKGEERGKNTMYKFEIDDISILHCGDLGHALSSELISEINGADIVLVPVGGIYTIDADEARQVAEKLEPSIVIPMHYRDDEKKPNIERYSEMSSLSDFLDKVGVANVEPEKKLKIKKSDLGEEEMKIVVLEPQA